MPCNEPLGPFDEPISIGHKVKIRVIDIENKINKEKIDKLTNMLCSLCSKLSLENLPEDVKQWYSEHLENDRQRVYKTFEEKYSNFSETVKNMSGEELRKLEEVLDKI